MKKLILLTSMAVFSFGMISESRAECANNQTCGDDCCWSIDNGTLNITGSGKMDGYEVSTDQPWNSQKDSITAINVSGVDNIGYRAFQFLDKVNNVILSDSVKEIEHRAFWGNTSLTSIDLNKAEIIGQGAFYKANNLSSVSMPNVTSIGRSAFYDNQLTSVNIPEGVTSIGEGAFYDNQLTSVNIPGSVTSIGNWAFGFNQLTSVDIPEGVTSIGDSAFSQNGYDDENGNFIPTLTSINLPDSLESIGEKAFFGAAFTNLDIPDSVETIGDAAFIGSKLEKLILPDNINFSGSRAFNLADENAQILCRGDFENCKNNLQQKNLISKFVYSYYNKNGSLSIEFSEVGDFDFSNYGVAKDGDCNTANYYYDGRNCNYEPDAASRVCDHEISGYVKVGDYCASPENSYAKKHYTPAEANQWLHDGNDNFVVLTFKK